MQGLPGTQPRGLWLTGLCLLQVGSFGNGTVIRGTMDVELVVFLSCFHSFQEEAKHHQAALRLLRKKASCCQDLLALGLSDLRVVQGVPDTLVLSIETGETEEPINVTIVPAYRALGKGSRSPQHTPALPRDLQLPHLSFMAISRSLHSFILSTNCVGN